MNPDTLNGKCLNGNDPTENGVQLALDPNLITLPLRSSAITPLPVTTTTNASQQDGAAPDNLDATGAASQESLRATAFSDQSLVKNPYEIFGKMPLNQLIPLVIQQRGPGFKFADLSEEELLFEIENEQSKNLQDANGKSVEGVPAEKHHDKGLMATSEEKGMSAGPEEDQFAPSEVSQAKSDDSVSPKYEDEVESITQEQFLNARKDMVEHINHALNESSLALEFLSLLLSSVRESAAIASMSPFLKKTAPVGSLNSDKLPLVPHTKEVQVSSEVLSRGWKLRSLNESRALLKEKYLKLKEVMTREHQYWEKISRYINNKDVIFKIRDKSNGLRLLGIKYGYEDSGSNFRRDRGVAVLRNNPEQNILELVPSSDIESTGSLRDEKFVRVRIFTKMASEDDYILTGESSLSKLFLNNGAIIKNDPEDIRSQIKRLKAFAFERELMYQLKRETSHLISYGVTIENENKVAMELPNEKFEMEFVSLDDDSVVNHVQDAPKVNDRRATLLLTTLRLLLVAMFKKNLLHRLTSPTLASSKSGKDVLLLRPLLGRLRHHNYKILLRKILKDYILDIIEGSTLKENALVTSETQDSEDPTELDANVAKLTKEIQAFNSLLGTCRTKFEINLQEKGSFTLILESPNYCNAVVSVKYISCSKDVSFDTKFSEFKEVEEFLHFIVTEYMKDSDTIKKNEE